MDLVGGATWYGDNTDYGANADRMKQDVSYAAQIMGRYMPDATTTFGIGLGRTWGGETNIEHVNQDNELGTTNLRLTATKFVTPPTRCNCNWAKTSRWTTAPAKTSA